MHEKGSWGDLAQKTEGTNWKAQNIRRKHQAPCGPSRSNQYSLRVNHDFLTVACMSLRFDLDLDTTQNLRDPLGLESLWVNRNLEKNGGFETLWVILPGGWQPAVCGRKKADKRAGFQLTSFHHDIGSLVPAFPRTFIGSWNSRAHAPTSQG